MAQHPLTEDRRQAICAWLTANHIDPNNVPRDSPFDITTGPDGRRVLRYEEYVRDEAGRIIAHEETGEAVREARSVPLVVEPPEELAWLLPAEEEQP